MIRDSRDLRIKYDALVMFRQLLEETGKTSDEAQALIRDYKKEIRDYFKRDKDKAHLVKDYGIDGYIEKLIVPFDISDAELWFEEEVYIPSPNSYYDCTGRVFTGWHRIYKQGERTVIYHRVCVDC